MDNIKYITASNAVLALYNFDQLWKWAKELPNYSAEEFETVQEMKERGRSQSLIAVRGNLPQLSPIYVLPLRDEDGILFIAFAFADNPLDDGSHRFTPQL